MKNNQNHLTHLYTHLYNPTSNLKPASIQFISPTRENLLAQPVRESQTHPIPSHPFPSLASFHKPSRILTHPHPSHTSSIPPSIHIQPTLRHTKYPLDEFSLRTTTIKENTQHKIKVTLPHPHHSPHLAYTVKPPLGIPSLHLFSILPIGVASDHRSSFQRKVQPSPIV